MTAVERYRRPHPVITDHRDEDAESCPGTARDGRNAWWCTRVTGHDGDHQAGGPGGVMYASWPAETTNDGEGAS